MCYSIFLNLPFGSADIDECLDNPCKDGELCFNKPGTYECIRENDCPGGYILVNQECVSKYTSINLQHGTMTSQ